MTELLIGTAKGLFRIGGTSAFEGRAITALAFDGSKPCALIDGHEVWTEDGGWRIAARLEDLEGEGESLLATPDRVLVGTGGAHLYRLADGALDLVEAFEEAPGRSDWYTPWGGPPAVRSMSEAGGTLFVNVHVGGILRSTDLRAFEPTIDIDTDVHEVLAVDNAVAAALGVEGVARSDDRGDTWRITTEGLHGGYVRAVARAGDALLVTASSGPFANDGAVYRDDGTGFERCTEGLPARADGNIDTGWLATRGSTAAVAWPDGSIYRSDDAGAHWERVAEGLPEPQWLVLA